MKKILVLVVVVFCFLVTDTVISAVLATAYAVINHLIGSAYSVASIPEAALFIGVLRLIYYFLPSVICFYCLNKILDFTSRSTQLTMINFLVYTSLSIVFAFLVNPNDVFLNPLFYIVGISTFASPYLLAYIPYFQRLIVKLYDYNLGANTSLRTV